MKTLNKVVLIGLLFLFCTPARAQEKVEMADGMRAEGKIYVVIAIILVILFGFIGYLFMLDRKISKLEEQISSRAGKIK